MAQKPSIPKGTRDFSPLETVRRNYIFNTIRDVYELFGYQQIETPAMENLSTLMGKYGEEGDRLLFRILNSGNFLSKTGDEELAERNALKLANAFCEKGLRYDLTVPFARYVVMHREELQLPFKRYQLQPVWRADRPQRGRYREFYQCDGDVVGSDSLLNEVELLQIADAVFSRLGIRVQIRLNNRKILTGIADATGVSDKLVELTVAIDKLDKIGLEGVKSELTVCGFAPETIEKIEPILRAAGSNDEKLAAVSAVVSGSEAGMKGIEETLFILNTLKSVGTKNEVVFDPALARGLSYYTGAIFEVKAVDFSIGSISGGGRYDNLTGIFGMPGLSGVGISFGADRIYDVLHALDLFPTETASSTRILFVNFGESEAAWCLPVIRQLRDAGVRTEIYPDQSKMKKQMAYANAKHIPYVALVGETEKAAGKVMLRNMESGEQQLVSIEELINGFAETR